jgi:hypothetical protein
MDLWLLFWSAFILDPRMRCTNFALAERYACTLDL